MSAGSVSNWLARLKAGDQAAAQPLWEFFPSGNISAHVEVHGVNESPEPGGLVLTELGASLLLGAGWRAWVRRRVAAPAA